MTLYKPISELKRSVKTGRHTSFALRCLSHSNERCTNLFPDTTARILLILEINGG